MGATLVDHHDHVDLLRAGVAGAGNRWGDFGSGTGAFTLALAELLGPAAEIWSVDRDAAALDEQCRRMKRLFPAIVVRFVIADFVHGLSLPPLDGFVMANSLHFVPDQAAALARLVGMLRPGGRVVVVEYDADRGNAWVPYPIAFLRWQTLAAGAGLVDVREIGRRPSRFLGSIYSAVGEMPAAGRP